MNTEDPFYTRQDAAPVDIYGTHVYTQRARFANSAYVFCFFFVAIGSTSCLSVFSDNNTESTGTNSGGHAILESRTPLLGGGEHTWQNAQPEQLNHATANRYI